MKLIFATHNPNKFIEVKKLIPDFIKLLSLHEIGCYDEIAETGLTIAENALIKANYVSKKYDFPCFSDDTGLLVDALNGLPGVYSARYAGVDKNANANINKLLTELKPHQNRSAQFETVIALNLSGENHLFKGVVKGSISTEKKGSAGFGYDPIFIPDGYTQTFAEWSMDQKNAISHRASAITQLISFLKTLPDTK